MTDGYRVLTPAQYQVAHTPPNEWMEFPLDEENSVWLRGDFHGTIHVEFKGVQIVIER